MSETLYDSSKAGDNPTTDEFTKVILTHAMKNGETPLAFRGVVEVGEEGELVVTPTNERIYAFWDLEGHENEMVFIRTTGDIRSARSHLAQRLAEAGWYGDKDEALDVIMDGQSSGPILTNRFDVYRIYI